MLVSCKIIQALTAPPKPTVEESDLLSFLENILSWYGCCWTDWKAVNSTCRSLAFLALSTTWSVVLPSCSDHSRATFAHALVR